MKFEFQHLRLLYLRELRSALRERGVVTGSLLMPLILGPVALWLLMSLIGFVLARQGTEVMRIGLGPLPAEHMDLEDALREAPDLGVVAWPGEDAMRRLLQLGAVDAALVFGEAGPSGDGRPAILISAAAPQGQRAGDRLAQSLATYREAWLAAEVEALGIPTSDWRVFDVESRNLAPGFRVAGFLLGLLVPTLAVMMVAVGCFYPAVDTLAGEHERSTWETTATLAVPRHTLVLAKYLHVATFGALAGISNILAVTLAMRAIVAPVLGASAAEWSFRLPWGALPVILLTIVVLALVLAAGMVLLASVARTFREGQALAGPFLLATLVPLLVVQAPDTELTYGLAWIPVASTVLVVRGALVGVYAWGPMAVSLLSQGALIVACLALGHRWIARENIWLGAGALGGGALGRFLRRGVVESHDGLGGGR